METNSAMVYKLLTSLDQDYIAHDALATKHMMLIRRDWVIQVSQIYRETNRVANGIANWVFYQVIGEHLLVALPLAIRRLLLADLAGTTYTRTFLVRNMSM